MVHFVLAKLLLTFFIGAITGLVAAGLLPKVGWWVMAAMPILLCLVMDFMINIQSKKNSTQRSSETTGDIEMSNRAGTLLRTSSAFSVESPMRNSARPVKLLSMFL